MSSIIDRRQKTQAAIMGDDYEPHFENSIQSNRRVERAAEEEAAWKAAIDDNARKRAYEFDAKYQAGLDQKKVAYSQTMLDELELARRQAAGKLGFAMSSGPGTSGLAVAGQNALDRQFAMQRATGLNRIDAANADFRLSWDLNEDKFDYGFEQAELAFKHQQAFIRQQAELNSASWWEQLGGIVGFGIGQAVEYFKPVPTYGGANYA